MKSGSAVWRMFVVTSLTMVAACSNSKTITRQIGNHTFKMPREYVVEATVFYLPSSQKKSVRFVINPNAPAPQQNMVSFHLDATCPPMDNSKPREADCKIVAIPLTRLENEEIERLGDAGLWEYRFKKTGELVAYCSAIDAAEGLCTHYGIFKDLPYELSLRDSQMADLIRLRRSVEDKLSQWEVN